MSQLQQYKCPACGGKLEFESGSQKMACPYCSTEFEIETIRQMQDLESNDQSDDILWERTSNNEWQESELAGMKVYSCNSCGGEIVCDEHTASSTCPYCDSPVIMSAQFSGGDRPDLIIPFQLDKKAAVQKFKKHIVGYGKFVPKLFKDENHIKEIKGLYVPFWLFDTHTKGQAQYIGTRTRSWSDSDYNYVQTSYYSIIREGELSFENVPADGASQLDDELMQSIEPFDLSDAVMFNTMYMSGYMADKYDVDVDEAALVVNERIRNSTADILAGSAHSDYETLRTKNCTIQLNQGSSKYVFYPVWILNTLYQDKKLQFAMNGQTGKFVGDIPIDWGIAVQWFFIYWIGSAAVVYFIIFLYVFL